MKKTRAIWPAAIGGVTVWRLGEAYGYLSWQYWGSLLGLLAACTVIALRTLRVRLATMTDHAPLPPVSEEEFSGEPPPLDPTFRGMSGPPPKS